MARLVVDEVVTKYTMDPDGYVKGVTTIKQKNADLIKSHSDLTGPSGISGLKTQFLSAAHVATSFAGAIAAAGAAIAGAGAYAFKEYASFDSLTRSLVAVEGGADRAKVALDDLKKIAKSPGVDFEEAVRGYGGLRRQGLGSEFSKRIVAEAGNANAYGGGNKQTFEQIMRAMMQIAAKPYLQGDELLQLNEAGIGAQKMIEKRFGTSNTEELKKRGIGSQQVLAGLVEELSKLERVGDGPQNAIDNFFSAIHFGVVNAGAGLAGFMGPLTQITGAIERATDDNVFATAVSSFADSLGILNLNAEDADAAVMSVAAGFMTLGNYLSNFRYNVESLIDLFRTMAQISVKMGPITWGIRKAMGLSGFNVENFAAGKSGLSPDGTDQDGFEKNLNILLQQKALAESRRKKEERKKAKLKNSEEQTIAPTEHPLSQNLLPVLNRIADNTSPLKELQNQVMGGGAQSKNAVNRQDLSDLHTGRGSGSGVEGIVNRFARDLVTEIIRSQGGGRREA